jgi:F0F1-type ATP synthase assembly protein I
VVIETAEPSSQSSRRRIILISAAAVVVAAVVAVVVWPSNGADQPTGSTTRPTIGAIVGPAQVELTTPLSRP